MTSTDFKMEALIVEEAAYQAASADPNPRFFLQLAWDGVEAALARLVRLEELPAAAVEIGAFYQCAAAVRGEYTWSDPFLTRPELIAPVRRCAERLERPELAAVTAEIEAAAAHEPSFAAFRAGLVGDDAELEAIERRMWGPLGDYDAEHGLPYPDPLIAIARRDVGFERVADGDALTAAWRRTVAALPDYEGRLSLSHPARPPTAAPAAAQIGERYLEGDDRLAWRPGHPSADPAALFGPVWSGLSEADRAGLESLDGMTTTGGARVVAIWADRIAVFDAATGAELGR